MKSPEPGRANRPGEPLFPLPLRASAREPLLQKNILIHRWRRFPQIEDPHLHPSCSLRSSWLRVFNPSSLGLRVFAGEPLLLPVNPIQKFLSLARLRLKAPSSQRNPSFVHWCLREKTSFYSTVMTTKHHPNPGIHPKSLRSQIGQMYYLN